jgi:hypothetical protein
MQNLAPRRSTLAVALEFGERLVEQLFLRGGWADALQKIVLLKLAEALEDLRPFFGFELGQFRKDFSFAHDFLLRCAGVNPVSMWR